MDQLARAVTNSIKQSPTKGLADYRTFRVCEAYDGEGYGLNTTASPFYARRQMPRDLCRDVADLCQARGLPSHVLDRLDSTDYGTAAAILFRLLDKSLPDPVAAIVAELDALETEEANAAGFVDCEPTGIDPANPAASTDMKALARSLPTSIG